MNKIAISTLAFILIGLFSPTVLSSKNIKYKSIRRAYLPDTIPLIELGLNLWKTFPGGLYPNGLNKRPFQHEKDGQELSKNLIALDSFGQADPINGKIVLLSIGMSNATQEFSAFKMLADTFRNKNPKVLVVDGAQGGQTASVIKNPNANFWTVVTQRLYQQKVNGSQVQAVWLKEANANPTAAFPKHAEDLKNDIKQIVQILKQKYPNLKLLYLSSRIYAGYANTPLNPEPYAYESGYSIKWLIEEQINGDSSLLYNGSNPKSPWLSWGPYLWANGVKPRIDGLVWSPTDFGTDGTHPSNAGRLKVANLLLQFFSTDSSCISWFLKQTTTDLTQIKPAHSLVVFPNPFINSFTVSWDSKSSVKTQINLINAQGKTVEKLYEGIPSEGQQSVNFSEISLHTGLYFIEFKTKDFVQRKKLMHID